MSDIGEIHRAQEALLDALGAHADGLLETGGDAFRAGRLDEAEAVLGRARAIQAIVEEHDALAVRLAELLGEEQPDPAPGVSIERRLPAGRRTPRNAYRAPILRALTHLGGRAEIGAVLKRVYDEMKDRLTEHDLQPMPSRSEDIRWCYEVRWCRYAMHQEGLLRADSPRGEWEITDAGRQWLAEQN